MNNQAGTVVALTVVSAGINAYHSATKNGAKALDLPGTAIANATLLLTFVGIGQFLDWNLAVVLAVLYFMGTMFTNGLPFIDLVDRLTK